MRLLNRAVKARVEEIRLYEINIFNFTHITQQIGEGGDLQEYKRHLEGLIAENRREVRKVTMTLLALRAQISQQPWWRRWLV